MNEQEMWDVRLELWTEDGDGEVEFLVQAPNVLNAISKAISNKGDGTGLHGSKAKIITVTARCRFGGPVLILGEK